MGPRLANLPTIHNFLRMNQSIDLGSINVYIFSNSISCSQLHFLSNFQVVYVDFVYNLMTGPSPD